MIKIYSKADNVSSGEKNQAGEGALRDAILYRAGLTEVMMLGGVSH